MITFGFKNQKRGTMIVDELKILKEEHNKVNSDFKHRECDIISKYTNCTHDYGNVEYSPEKISEEVWETKWQGVDCYPALVGYKEVIKDRWARQCKKCGKVQYTYKRNKTVQEFEFDD